MDENVITAPAINQPPDILKDIPSGPTSMAPDETAKITTIREGHPNQLLKELQDGLIAHNKPGVVPTDYNKFVDAINEPRTKMLYNVAQKALGFGGSFDEFRNAIGPGGIYGTTNPALVGARVPTPKPIELVDNNQVTHPTLNKASNVTIKSYSDYMNTLMANKQDYSLAAEQDETAPVIKLPNAPPLSKNDSKKIIDLHKVEMSHPAEWPIKFTKKEDETTYAQWKDTLKAHGIDVESEKELTPEDEQKIQSVMEKYKIPAEPSTVNFKVNKYYYDHNVLLPEDRLANLAKFIKQYGDKIDPKKVIEYANSQGIDYNEDEDKWTIPDKDKQLLDKVRQQAFKDAINEEREKTKDPYSMQVLNAAASSTQGWISTFDAYVALAEDLTNWALKNKNQFWHDAYAYSTQKSQALATRAYTGRAPDKNEFFKTYADMVADVAKNKLAQKNKELGKEDEAIDPMYDDLKLGNFGGFFQKAGVNLAELIPVILPFYLGGAAGMSNKVLAAYGTGVALDNYYQMGMDKDIPNLTKFVASLTNGLTMAAFGKLGPTNMRQAVIESLSKNPVQDVSKALSDGTNIASRWTLGISDAVAKTSANIINSGMTFGMMRFDNNLTKWALMPTPEAAKYDPTEGVSDDFFVGCMQAGLFVAVPVTWNEARKNTYFKRLWDSTPASWPAEKRIEMVRMRLGEDNLTSQWANANTAYNKSTRADQRVQISDKMKDIDTRREELKKGIKDYGEDINKKIEQGTASVSDELEMNAYDINKIKYRLTNPTTPEDEKSGLYKDIAALKYDRADLLTQRANNIAEKLGMKPEMKEEIKRNMPPPPGEEKKSTEVKPKEKKEPSAEELYGKGIREVDPNETLPMGSEVWQDLTTEKSYTNAPKKVKTDIFGQPIREPKVTMEPITKEEVQGVGKSLEPTGIHPTIQAELNGIDEEHKKEKMAGWGYDTKADQADPEGEYNRIVSAVAEYQSGYITPEQMLQRISPQTDQWAKKTNKIENRAYDKIKADEIRKLTNFFGDEIDVRKGDLKVTDLPRYADEPVNNLPKNVKDQINVGTKPTTNKLRNFIKNRTNLWVTLPLHGTQISVANEDEVMRTFCMDFTQGGHGTVYPAWMPKLHAWISSHQPIKRRISTALHEVTEKAVMDLNPDMMYDAAHDYSKVIETAWIMGGIDKIKDPQVLNESIKRPEMIRRFNELMAIPEVQEAWDWANKEKAKYTEEELDSTPGEGPEGTDPSKFVLKKVAPGEFTRPTGLTAEEKVAEMERIRELNIQKEKEQRAESLFKTMKEKANLKTINKETTPKGIEIEVQESDGGTYVTGKYGDHKIDVAKKLEGKGSDGYYTDEEKPLKVAETLKDAKEYLKKQLGRIIPEEPVTKKETKAEETKRLKREAKGIFTTTTEEAQQREQELIEGRTKAYQVGETPEEEQTRLNNIEKGAQTLHIEDITKHTEPIDPNKKISKAFDNLNSLLTKQALDNVPDAKQQSMLKNLYDVIDGLVELGITKGFPELENKLREAINKSFTLGKKAKEFYHEFVTAFREKLEKYFTDKQKAWEERRRQKGETQHLVTSLMSEANNWAEEDDKVKKQMSVYAPFENSVIETTGMTREQVKKMSKKLGEEFYYNMPDNWNEESLKKWMDEVAARSDLHNGYISHLKELNKDEITSMLNFYGSSTLHEAYGLIINDSREGKTTIHKVLNKADESTHFRNIFLSHLRTFSITNKSGQRLDGEMGLEYAWRMYKNERDQAETISEKHKAGLKFLEQVTGISAKTWSQYFTDITHESTTLAKKVGGKWVRMKSNDYPNYEAMLDDSQGKYYGNEAEPREWNRWKAPSNLLETLGARIDRRTDKSIHEILTDYFTEGSAGRGIGGTDVRSNLKKLASAIAREEDINFSYKDINNNLTSSLYMASMMGDRAKNIHKITDMSNPFIDYYKKLGRPARWQIFRGLISQSAGTRRVVEPGDLSFDDLLLHEVINYLSGENSYNQNLGQFADKNHIYVMDVPKYESGIDPVTGQEADYGIKDIVNDYDKAFDLVDGILRFNGSIDLISKIKDKDKFIDEFLWNWTHNAKYINETFRHWDQDGGTYKDLADMAKRSGSHISNGIKPNQQVEGGLKKAFTHMFINDPVKFLKRYFTESKLADGIVLFKDGMAKKAQVSWGSVQARKDEFPNLTSMKVLYDHMDDRGLALTKGNWINVDVMARNHPGSHWERLANLMEQMGAESASFPSTSKIMEQGTKVYDAFKGDKWMEKKITKKDKKDYVFDRSTDGLYWQQDLRHPEEIKLQKQPAQTLGNALAFDIAKKFVNNLNIAQQRAVREFIEETFENGITTDESLASYLAKNVSEQNHEELKRLLDEGMTLNSPEYRSLMRVILASNLSHDAVEQKVNRSTLQEVPALDVSLKGYRQEGGHVHLAEITCNIPGIRYAEFHDTREECEKALEANPDNYKNIKKWMIQEEKEGKDKGKFYIPGDFVNATRVPADDLHSHTIAHAKYRINEGNFISLDNESRHGSGADFDGDMRFVWTKFKDPAPLSNQAALNNSFDDLVSAYQNPRYFEHIITAVNPESYNHIQDRIRDKQAKEGKMKYQPQDIMGWKEQYDNTIVGNKMKSQMTNNNTIASYIIALRLPFKGEPLKIRVGKEELVLSGAINDQFGIMKGHIGNIQNIFFDYGKNAKPELGWNEHVDAIGTMLMIASKDRFDKVTDPLEYDREVRGYYDENKRYHRGLMDFITDYLNQPMVKDFVDKMRNSTSVGSSMSSKDAYSILQSMQEKYSDTAEKREQFKTFQDLYWKSKDLIRLKELHDLTMELPHSPIDVVKKLGILKMITQNNLKAFDTSNIWTSKKLWTTKNLDKLSKINLPHNAKSGVKERWQNAAGVFRKELRDRGFKTTYDLIAAGLRTETTRSPNNFDLKSLKPGDIARIVTTGRPDLFVEITDVSPKTIGELLKENPNYADKWSVREGWDKKYLTDNPRIESNVPVGFRLITPVDKDPNYQPALYKRDSEMLKYMFGLDLDADRMSVFFRNAIHQFVLSLDAIHASSPEFSATGLSVLTRVNGVLNAGKDHISRDQLERVFKGINNIIAIRALDNGMTYEQLRDSLTKDITDFRKAIENAKFDSRPMLMKLFGNDNRENLNNEFLNSIVRARDLNNNPVVQIASDYKDGDLSDQQLQSIKQSFDLLTPETQRELQLYSYYKYGTSIGMGNGSYNNLISDKYRIETSKLADTEVQKWRDGLPMKEIEDISNLILRDLKIDPKDRREVKNIYDINANIEPFKSTKWDVLADAAENNKVDDMRKWGEKEKVDVKDLMRAAQHMEDTQKSFEEVMDLIKKDKISTEDTPERRQMLAELVRTLRMNEKGKAMGMVIPIPPEWGAYLANKFNDIVTESIEKGGSWNYIASRMLGFLHKSDIYKEATPVKRADYQRWVEYDMLDYYKKKIIRSANDQGFDGYNSYMEHEAQHYLWKNFSIMDLNEITHDQVEKITDRGLLKLQASQSDDILNLKREHVPYPPEMRIYAYMESKNLYPGLATRYDNFDGHGTYENFHIRDIFDLGNDATPEDAQHSMDSFHRKIGKDKPLWEVEAQMKWYKESLQKMHSFWKEFSSKEIVMTDKDTLEVDWDAAWDRFKEALKSPNRRTDMIDRLKSMHPLVSEKFLDFIRAYAGTERLTKMVRTENAIGYKQARPGTNTLYDMARKTKGEAVSELDIGDWLGKRNADIARFLLHRHETPVKKPMIQLVAKMTSEDMEKISEEQAEASEKINEIFRKHGNDAFDIIYAPKVDKKGRVESMLDKSVISAKSKEDFERVRKAEITVLEMEGNSEEASFKKKGLDLVKAMSDEDFKKIQDFSTYIYRMYHVRHQAHIERHVKGLPELPIREARVYMNVVEALNRFKPLDGDSFAGRKRAFDLYHLLKPDKFHGVNYRYIEAATPASMEIIGRRDFPPLGVPPNLATDDNSMVAIARDDLLKAPTRNIPVNFAYTTREFLDKWSQAKTVKEQKELFNWLRKEHRAAIDQYFTGHDIDNVGRKPRPMGFIPMSGIAPNLDYRLQTHNRADALRTSMGSMIENFYAHEMEPLMLYGVNHYKNLNLKQSQTYIEKELSRHIYKDDTEKSNKWFPRMVRDIVGWAQVGASFRMVAMAPQSVIGNVTGGLAMDFASDAKMTALGLFNMGFDAFKAMFRLGKNRDDMRKVYNIMGAHKFIAIVDDVKFNQWANFMKTFNKTAFLSVEIPEFIIQGSYLYHHMNRQRLDAYDVHGNIIPGQEGNAFSASEITRIRHEIMNLQGAYGKNRAQYSYTFLGRVLSQFRVPWMYAQLTRYWHPGYTDFNNVYHQGWLIGAVNTTKIGLMKLSPRFAGFLSERTREKLKNKDPHDVSWIDSLTADFKENGITMSDMPKDVRLAFRNLAVTTAMGLGAFVMMRQAIRHMKALMMSLGGQDETDAVNYDELNWFQKMMGDDELYVGSKMRLGAMSREQLIEYEKTKWWQNFWMGIISNEVIPTVGPVISSFTKSPVPAIMYLKKILLLAYHGVGAMTGAESARYQHTADYYDKGDAKWVNDLLAVVPLAGLPAEFYKWQRILSGHVQKSYLEDMVESEKENIIVQKMMYYQATNHLTDPEMAAIAKQKIEEYLPEATELAETLTLSKAYRGTGTAAKTVATKPLEGMKLEAAKRVKSQKLTKGEVSENVLRLYKTAKAKTEEIYKSGKKK